MAIIDWMRQSIRLIDGRPEFPEKDIEVGKVGFKGSKTLTYVTKQSLKWLVEAIPYALNTYAIEWKVHRSSFVLRLSQNHDHIAYYDCYRIRFYKLTLRSVYGIKVSDSIYSTRSFHSPNAATNKRSSTILGMSPSEAARKEMIRKDLADCLRDLLQQLEKDVIGGRPWPPGEAPAARAPYELDTTYAVAELAGEERMKPVELDGQTRVIGLGSMEIAELPG